jgi:hypothetical protein
MAANPLCRKPQRFGRPITERYDGIASRFTFLQLSMAISPARTRLLAAFICFFGTYIGTHDPFPIVTMSISFCCELATFLRNLRHTHKRQFLHATK